MKKKKIPPNKVKYYKYVSKKRWHQLKNVLYLAL